MSAYRVYVTPSTWQALKKLPGHVRQRARRMAGDLATQPRPTDSRALDVSELGDIGLELRRIRLDKWRIVYAVAEEEGYVYVLAVRKRPPYDYDDLADLAAQIE